MNLSDAISDSYRSLLERIYQGAQQEHLHFFGQKAFYDWFVLDEYTILALLDLLNRYNFRGISADVLGRVYNEGYIEAKERSKRGQFYTPPQIVEYMLDAIGIPAEQALDEPDARTFLYQSVGDLSCGSGSFLVAAARRKSTLLQRLVAQQEIAADYALQLLTEKLLGFDLNPFACYLAEINLLIQCLPFLLDESGTLCRSVKRFHIYCTDALEPTLSEQVHALLDGTATERLTLPETHARKQALSDDERTILSIKDTKLLPFDALEEQADHHGLDYLLGNPPYVSAGESMENLRYRQKVREFGIYHLLHQRWDLFIPFFERNLQFLCPGTGRLGIVVSKGIETEGYAEGLRQILRQTSRILQIDFFPGLRLFRDAAIENTIVFIEKYAPEPEHQVIRRKHLQADGTRFETLPAILQSAPQEQLFRWRYDAARTQHITAGTIPLSAIAYVGTGIVAQSKEQLDPLVNGKRQKRFTLDDVFLPPAIGQQRPEHATEDGIVGNDVDRYYLRRTRYVAYEHYKAQISRPRHVALFRTAEKLLLGETSGGYYDRAGLFANHSVQVVVPWQALMDAGALEEKGIKTVLRESKQIASINADLAPLSSLVDLRYILGIINSAFIRKYLTNNALQGTRAGRIYPDVWKRLPIKLATTERQMEIAQLVDQIQTLHQPEKHTHPAIAAALEQVELLVECTYNESSDVEAVRFVQAVQKPGTVFFSAMAGQQQQ